MGARRHPARIGLSAICAIPLPALLLRSEQGAKAAAQDEEEARAIYLETMDSEQVSKCFQAKCVEGEVSAGGFEWQFSWAFDRGELVVEPSLGRALIEDALRRFLVRSDYDALSKHGLTCESIHGDFQLPSPKVYRSAEDIGQVDLVIVTWKATANEHLRTVLPPLLHDDTRVLTLQNGGRMTAREIADKLEVSERTVLRDIEALSGSGVPVYAVRGCNGGFELLDTFQQEVPALPVGLTTGRGPTCIGPPRRCDLPR